MLEGMIGFVIGGVVFFCSAKLDCHRHRTKRVVELEKEYVTLQGHVNDAVDSIDRIIHGSKP